MVASVQKLTPLTPLRGRFGTILDILRKQITNVFIDGWVAERFNAPVLKTGDVVRHPWVRIPPHPLIFPADHFGTHRFCPVFPMQLRISCRCLRRRFVSFFCIARYAFISRLGHESGCPSTSSFGNLHEQVSKCRRTLLYCQLRKTPDSPCLHGLCLQNCEGER